MTELEQLIIEFNLSESDDDKSGINRDDFDFLDDNNKWDFLLPLLVQEKTYDLIKVEIFKVIQIADFSGLYINKIKNTILGTLKDEEDEMVRQYGFMSLPQNFSIFADVLDYCIETVEDEKEDINVRHCAFSVLKESENLQKISLLRDRILEVKDFQEYSTDIFNAK